MADLENQVFLITGCSSGIGRALVEEFARRGHRVLATARSRDSIEELASDRIRTARLDVTASSPPTTLRAGKNSVRLPIIGRLPTSLRDRIFSRRFGLDRLSQ